MLQPTSIGDEALCHELLHQPSNFEYRYTSAADRHLRQVLFRSLAANRNDYLRLLFPDGPPVDRSRPWSLKEAQGAQDGAEYTAAAKGTACGHIFKTGESTYQCKTCAADDTCVLCSRCFESSDHEGHNVFISVSPGNSGCCDCGDSEAWRREVRCSIHTAGTPDQHAAHAHKDKAKAPVIGSQLPPDLVEAIRMTIARVVDYLCDVFSCSPEQLRLPKSETSVRLDEETSHLGLPYGQEPAEPQPEFALVLWNDEKHTVDDVQNQVARACSETKRFGRNKAMEVDAVGRSVIRYSTDVRELLRMAEIIEQIKVTVTIRSSRDTFREQMCSTIADWIQDISGCAVGPDTYILRNTVCEELLKPWRSGSQGTNADVGKGGIDDHEMDENEKLRRRYRTWLQPFTTQPGAPNVVRVQMAPEPEETNDDDNNEIFEDENDEEDDVYEEMEVEDEGMEIDVEDIRRAANAAMAAQADAADMDIDYMDENEDVTEALEATLAGYPPPPPPPPPALRRRHRIFTPAESEDGDGTETTPASNAPYSHLPKTPKTKGVIKGPTRPSKHWLEKPEAYRAPRPSEPCEDLWQRVRLDFLILYDLRLWKVLRVNLRHLYITTVVTIPNFKRILGLRFAGLYTTLAQLYLIADREPDHSIINLSVQMLTTPSITEEVVERGNFFTNLMAILYTFLTTRQVGFPEEVNLKATLAFDAGAVTNRRIFHFFMDLRWLCQSEFIHYKTRVEPRYLLQFLDLVKLHQGICPNVRATAEHVEYESDAWISASMIVKEVNKLCKQIAASFEPKADMLEEHYMHLQRALRTVAQVTMINSFGYERKRFVAAELKDDLAWHIIGPVWEEGRKYSVPKCVVQSEPMSFHHPLHYLLSWLIEDARTMSRDELRALLSFSPDDLKDPWNPSRTTTSAPNTLTSDELLSSIFDHPLRTYVWLAQMKAGMWVRNGITLRHQAHTYRSVNHRDVGYQRDILMIQAGLVLCGAENELPGERFLAQMLDRFEMELWAHGWYSVPDGFEEAQHLDVVEEFFHLLVIALSERGNLVPGPERSDRNLQRDIAHALCFKPLSFSDLKARLTDKVGDSDEFAQALQSMTNYRAPEGMSDTGTFELKAEYVEMVDPYYAHYSRNHREEAENIYKKHVARKTGRRPEDVVFEPKLPAIEAGLFAHLSAFTRTPLFVQIICAALGYAQCRRVLIPNMPATRVETFLHMVLHLVLLAVIEDRPGSGEHGFTDLAATFIGDLAGDRNETIVLLLVTLSKKEEYAACHASIKHILRKMQLRQPDKLSTVMGPLSSVLDRSNTGSPASLPAEDKEKKKQEALARQARVMARMKEQQQSFMQNQGLAAFRDDGDDFDEYDEMSVTADDVGGWQQEPQRKTWQFPSGTCILCQEDTDDQRLYGTFAYLGESNILRTTPVNDPEFVKEVFGTPDSLDRPADQIRPFGVAGANKQTITKVTADGSNVSFERQGLSRGFPHQHNATGCANPISTSCGHIMHFACFELYVTATQRRHNQQIARNHPERIELKEFTCPLCKALGNTFVPIIWKAKECAHDYELQKAKSLADWLASNTSDEIDTGLLLQVTTAADGSSIALRPFERDALSTRASQYVANMFSPSLVSVLQQLSLNSPPAASSSSSSSSPAPHTRLRRGYSLSSLFRIGRGDSGGGQDGGSNFLPTLSPSAVEHHQQPRMTELMKAYARIKETVRINGLGVPAVTVDERLHGADTLVALSRALALTLTAFEIAHRGVGPQEAASISLVGEMSEQSLTHLRILSETVQSYLAVNVLRNNGEKSYGQEVQATNILRLGAVMTAKLFGFENEVVMMKVREVGETLLFEDDIFLFFSDWLSLKGPTVADAADVLQLCYWAEVVKTVFVYRWLVRDPDYEKSSILPFVDEEDPVAQPVSDAFKLAVSGLVMEDQLRYGMPLSNLQLRAFQVLISKYALAFLRKAIVLMHVHYGLDFESPYNLDANLPELQRLSSLLHMPSVDDLCTLYTSHSVGGDRLRQVTKRWTAQAAVISDLRPRSEGSNELIRMSHPAIFELVGLPKNYDTLTEEALKRRCPTTGKELTDPVVCLFCGEIHCGQGLCCMKDKNKGGCYQHMAKHRESFGLFLNIRKCMVLFLHNPGQRKALDGIATNGGLESDGPNGSWMHAPYLDKHGEPDPTLRRHHQLFLHQRRYDKLLREAWLMHMIPTVISRKLEADINPGGWETL
ncbi:hypothetical protein BAUCODRAFT_34856 [Baudoinia panamericana UAMH 10762]|uniref:E3 ubiquitin-protein ligase n=1 Tax=Baudoinia panamericana (strain UAMH 10762) TaxID=717646 RepID=M2NB53_BAUPA|nr:uncharacterized protein BAUCODRAFT_34856 [Baudoinia panamericana UAMH 10762]EMC96080.1 hypothetical protein BAUCODRAFT_34856 [Baudoinia panamericana UAMH 10762]